jgi:SAM-dependent methyltransferase
LIESRLASVRAALDVQTGGGEVLAECVTLPPTMAATESWPPNLRRATELLHPRGVVVVAATDEPPLPFAADTFDLVISRHPVSVCWPELARVLRPGGTYLSQQVGPESAFELSEFFLGRLPAESYQSRRPEAARASAEAAGLTVVDLRRERLRMEFFDVGAVVWILRRCVWWVPDFTVDRWRDRLLAMHEQINRDGAFVAHSSRFLVEAHKPATE